MLIPDITDFFNLWRKFDYHITFLINKSTTFFIFGFSINIKQSFSKSVTKIFVFSH